MANNKKKQEQRIPYTKIEHSPNTKAEPANDTATHAPRPVKDTQKPRSLPRSGKK